MVKERKEKYVMGLYPQGFGKPEAAREWGREPSFGMVVMESGSWGSWASTTETLY